MTAETTARRLADHPQWRWEGGQLTLCGVRLHDGGRGYIIGYRSGPTCEGGGRVDTIDVSGFAPDLNDPATVGTIEAQVRAADPNGWFVLSLDDPGFWIERQRGTKSDALAVGSRTIGEAWALAFLEVAK